MFWVELSCGEEPCEITIAVVGDLDELEVLVCEGCGYCLHVLAIAEAEWVDGPAPAPLLLAA